VPRAHKLFALLFAAAIVPAAVATTASADPGGTPNPHADFGQSHKKVCPDTGQAGQAYCDSDLVTTSDGVTPLATTSYTNGYAPADLSSAYKYSLPASGSAWTWTGQTVAIVDAYDNPNAYNDLTAYRAQFGLPVCTTASGCFAKVNQNGAASPLPSGNTGWGQEIALDLDMASAVCPNCKILLVEANSAGFGDLGTAVDTAAARANTISNSYGGNEFSSEGSSTYNGHYNHPGHVLTVSSGDNGYGVEFPAASQYVTAVGGTSLTKSTSTSRGWTETAWNGAGSGCSRYIAKPAWQHDSGCARRTLADVSAVANPSTGVAVYDSYGSSGGANWLVFGGTSVASPIVASVYALAGNASTVTYGSFPYSHTSSLFDVTSGSNGHCRTTAYLCTAGAGYDGPTGLGTPNGTGAF
jgi:subtilase family serine protease